MSFTLVRDYRQLLARISAPPSGHPVAEYHHANEAPLTIQLDQTTYTLMGRAAPLQKVESQDILFYHCAIRILRDTLKHAVRQYTADLAEYEADRLAGCVRSAEPVQPLITSPAMQLAALHEYPWLVSMCESTIRPDAPGGDGARDTVLSMMRVYAESGDGSVPPREIRADGPTWTFKALFDPLHPVVLSAFHVLVAMGQTPTYGYDESQYHEVAGASSSFGSLYGTPTNRGPLKATGHRDEWYILNTSSLSGTYVDGELLVANKWTKLTEGAVVRFHQPTLNEKAYRKALQAAATEDMERLANTVSKPYGFMKLTQPVWPEEPLQVKDVWVEYVFRRSVRDVPIGAVPVLPPRWYNMAALVADSTEDVGMGVCMAQWQARTHAKRARCTEDVKAAEADLIKAEAAMEVAAAALAEANRTKAERKKVPNKADKEQIEEWKCGICLDLISECASLDCGHNYCRSCIDEWFKKNKKTCPVCKHKHIGKFNINIGVDTTLLQLAGRTLTKRELATRNLRKTEAVLARAIASIKSTHAAKRRVDKFGPVEAEAPASSPSPAPAAAATSASASASS